jgi:2-polyprenyl-6-methoxyphenol hydroxylase-like FAD-dependent oxidoreductase
VQDELSMAFGFIMARRDGRPFEFDAVTYRPSTVKQKVAYVTLFRFGDAIRANLFTYWSAKDALTRSMVKDPVATLGHVLPGMDAVIGDYVVEGRVEPFRIDLYRMQDCALPGVVLLGDAYQSVCPSTGMGLSKVLTDVDVLCNDLAPRWFATPGMGRDKTAELYADARKRKTDDRALKAALDGRHQIVNRSPIWQLRRVVRDWRWATGR